MPHWTTPKPNSSGLAAETAKAITDLQAELDKLFDTAAAVTASEIDTVASQVKTFYAEFERHLADAKKKLAAG